MHLCACVCVCDAAGGQQTTVVVAVPQTAMIAGDQPVQTTCANCHQTIVTNVVYETGGLTWLIFAILCIVGSVLQPIPACD